MQSLRGPETVDCTAGALVLGQGSCEDHTFSWAGLVHGKGTIWHLVEMNSDLCPS